MQRLIFLGIVGISIALGGCWGTHEFRVQCIPKIAMDKKLPGKVSFKVSTQEIYSHKLGFHEYKLHLKNGINVCYKKLLSEVFEGGVSQKVSDVNLFITALDTSIFPIASVIIDIRLFFKVEIFDKNMQKQKTAMIYGFGSDPDGNKALEKAISNSFYQLLPYLEEIFVP